MERVTLLVFYCSWYRLTHLLPMYFFLHRVSCTHHSIFELLLHTTFKVYSTIFMISILSKQEEILRSCLIFFYDIELLFHDISMPYPDFNVKR